MMNTVKEIQTQNPVPKMTVVQQAEDWALTSLLNLSVPAHLSGKWGSCLMPAKGGMTEAAFLLHLSFSSYSFMLLCISSVSPFPVCANRTFFCPLATVHLSFTQPFLSPTIPKLSETQLLLRCKDKRLWQCTIPPPWSIYEKLYTTERVKRGKMDFSLIERHGLNIRTVILTNIAKIP